MEERGEEKIDAINVRVTLLKKGKKREPMGKGRRKFAQILQGWKKKED